MKYSVGQIVKILGDSSELCAGEFCTITFVDEVNKIVAVRNSHGKNGWFVYEDIVAA